MPTAGAALNRLTLREQVLEALRSAITTGALLPGSDLGEVELAERYGVSRGTVREALRFLQQSRLVAGDARGKLKVHRAGQREIAEIFSVRAALEGLAVQSIIAGPDRAEHAERLRAAMPPETLKDEFATHMNLDLAFHEMLCELSGNSTLLDNWRTLEDRMRIVFFSADTDQPVPIMARSHHEPIVAAIEAADPEEARRTVQQHMNDASQVWASDIPVVPPR
ncbi:MAG TPA: GntR family transcriptional regulator [Flexivirga sp.]|uniref:GntR family transcriptional regulator n=1 Tax=Flexivirga sp. TaxID=1962927 RepID=UPI002BB3C2D7|nr:GntR family transcriptional regulator [Flexivirga sp.]HWC22500.1 GntR family transcriptional regulator [Flexivirga sp.]